MDTAKSDATITPPATTPAAAHQAQIMAELEQFHKQLLAARGKADVNALTSQFVKMILEQAIREGASDIHFDPAGDLIHLRFRVDGELRDRLSFSKKDFTVTAQIRVMAGFAPQAATAYTPEDGALHMLIGSREVRFRVSAFPTIHGDKLVLRVLDSDANSLSLDHLGFAPDVLAQLKSAISLPSGIFFVCGITGGGKTTTLCSILKTLNRPELNIMTLEDPVEYNLPRVVQSKINAKAGFNFADGLRAILRQDPNVIMVGEVRDVETAEIAMRAALTGHLIFTTIHTISAVGVVSRLIDMGIEPFLISNSMIGSLAQRLVRRICAQCAQAAPPSAQTMDEMLKPLDTDSRNLVRGILLAPGGKFVRPVGCPACGGTGFRGRVGIFELLVLTKDFRAQISAKADLSTLRRSAIEQGMKTMLMDGAAKAWSGWTTLEEVARAAKEM